MERRGRSARALTLGLVARGLRLGAIKGRGEGGSCDITRLQSSEHLGPSLVPTAQCKHRLEERDRPGAGGQARASKPPSIIVILGFVDYHRKWATVAREVNFGSLVASVIWGEQPAIETATRVGIPVRNHVVHAYHFQCEIVFLGQHIEWV